MQFENSFDVPLPPAEAWKVLLDVPRIAPCLPGAELTETIGPDKYKGRAGVKIGPVNLFFAGEAEILEKDEGARKARLKGRGNDTKGRGQASATVDFRLVEAGTGTRVEVTTDLNMTGMVAQYGRASGLMKEIAGAILTQFADNLRKEIERSTPAPATTSPTPEAAPAATTTGATDPAPALAAADSAAAPAPAATSQASPAPARSPAPAAVPVSAFSILWIALRNWIGGLFGRKS
jgi:carbon monoxide dehydrogenase subunit G